MFQRGAWDISQLPSPQIHSSAFLVLTRLHPSPAPVCLSTPVGCGQWETRLQIQEPGGDRLEVSLPCSPCSVTTFLSGASSPPVAVRKLASQMLLPLGSRRGVLPLGGPSFPFSPVSQGLSGPALPPSPTLSALSARSLMDMEETLVTVLV